MSFSFFIMTISNSRFDRIFSRINRLEEKLESLDSVTKYKRIQKIQNKIDKLESKLPQDEFEITHRGDGMFDIQVTDSPYDDTYVNGTPLKFSVSGVRQTDKGTQRSTASIMIHSFDNKEGSTFVGSSSFDRIDNNYPDAVATLYGEDNQILASTEIT
ncbi:hypothetical protein [Cyanophage S-TIM54]|nr:hypothetical protein [Cyanophage S-TIM54]